MATWQVVVTDQVYPDTDVEREILGAAGARLSVAGGARQEVLDAAGDADALPNTYLALDHEAIGRLARCRVARYGIGVDNVDLDAARREAGIPRHPRAPLLRRGGRHPHRGDDASAAAPPAAGGREGASRRRDLDGLRPVRRLSELTAGLVGYGRIARRLPGRCASWAWPSS